MCVVVGIEGISYIAANFSAVLKTSFYGELIWVSSNQCIIK